MPETSLHHFSPRPNRAHEIPWMEWGPDVFERARAEDKPVLLGLSAVWCHWCHVMDETTYSDQRVIDLVTSRFIPVRVDNDTRPDVNLRYNMGGWPTTAFLDSDGEVLVGLTYVPADRMVELLTRVNEAWVTQREDIRARIAEYRQQREERAAQAPGIGAVSSAIVDSLRTTLDEAYDVTNGGFGHAPKFPQVDGLRLLLRAALRHDDDEALRRVHFTVERMAGGGMYDHVEGGFFRYSTNADWSVPHFEKMSEDHGALLQLLAELGRVAEEEREFAEPIADQTIGYLDRTLSMHDGGFAGSQDADESYFALDEAGRSRVEAPYVDPRVYASWTAGLARGYLACGVTFERRDWLERGRRAVDFIWSRMRAGEAGVYRYWDGQPHLLGMLEDQAQTLLALLDAHETLGLSAYLDHAQQLARIIVARWRDPGRGFFDVTEGSHDTGLLAVRSKPIGDNADLAEAFLRLGRLSHDERYLRVANETLSDFVESYEGQGTQAAGYALAVERYLSAEPEIQVVSGASEEAARRATSIRERALQLPLATRTVQLLVPGEDDALMMQLGLPGDREGVGYVCVGTVCSEPVEHADELTRAITHALAATAY
jgi:uncharacterized protein YyaL (SSP411 family)